MAAPNEREKSDSNFDPLSALYGVQNRSNTFSQNPNTQSNERCSDQRLNPHDRLANPGNAGDNRGPGANVPHVPMPFCVTGVPQPPVSVMGPTEAVQVLTLTGAVQALALCQTVPPGMMNRTAMPFSGQNIPQPLPGSGPPVAMLDVIQNPNINDAVQRLGASFLANYAANLQSMSTQATNLPANFNPQGANIPVNLQNLNLQGPNTLSNLHNFNPQAAVDVQQRKNIMQPQPITGSRAISTERAPSYIGPGRPEEMLSAGAPGVLPIFHDKRVETLTYRPQKIKHVRSVLTRMEDVTALGPLSVLHRCVDERLKVKVWTRSYRHVRGICTGYIVAFDKHWNLAMRDIDEVYQRPRVHHVAHVSETHQVKGPASAAFDDDDDGEEEEEEEDDEEEEDKIDISSGNFSLEDLQNMMTDVQKEISHLDSDDDNDDDEDLSDNDDDDVRDTESDTVSKDTHDEAAKKAESEDRRSKHASRSVKELTDRDREGSRKSDVKSHRKHSPNRDSDGENFSSNDESASRKGKRASEERKGGKAIDLRDLLRRKRDDKLGRLSSDRGRETGSEERDSHSGIRERQKGSHYEHSPSKRDYHSRRHDKDSRSSRTSQVESIQKSERRAGAQSSDSDAHRGSSSERDRKHSRDRHSRHRADDKYGRTKDTRGRDTKDKYDSPSRTDSGSGRRGSHKDDYNSPRSRRRGGDSERKSESSERTKDTKHKNVKEKHNSPSRSDSEVHSRKDSLKRSPRDAQDKIRKERSSSPIRDKPEKQIDKKHQIVDLRSKLKQKADIESESKVPAEKLSDEKSTNDGEKVSKVPVKNISAVKKARKEKFLERHVNQLFMRGDNVVMVAIVPFTQE